jgi:hypothetical protein
MISDKIRGENHQKTRENVAILLQLHNCSVLEVMCVGEGKED